jgi:predicted ATPase
LAELLLVASRQAGDPVTRCVASLGLALSRFYTGRIAEATSALFDATAAYGDCAGHLAMLDLDQDPGVVAHGFLALALVVGGRLDEAIEPAETALALARGSRHALSLAAGLHLSCLVHQQLGNADLVAAYAAEELAVAREHVLPFWIGGGLFFSGWALARRGELTEGIARMSQGIDTYDATGAKLGLPSFRGDLASALIAAGDLDRAADVLDLALRQVQTQGERSYAAELQRISGDLLLRRDAGLGRDAEAHYLEGYRIGCRQGQHLYALRSARGLARVWRGDGRVEAACDLIRSSVAPFAGQVGRMPELLQARAMLGEFATDAPSTLL